jgi:diacylglycerol kinase family enzyme
MSALNTELNYDVVLNRNAGRVTPALIEQLQSQLPADRLHLTESLLHSREVLQECVQKGSETIFAGGGDGTIVDVINGLHEFSEGTPPTVGVLRLGTGNALAYWLNSSTPVADLNKWQSPHSHSIIEANMIEAEDTLFPFAGLGMDAAVLNDYNWVKRAAKYRWYSPMMKGMPGYLWAGYLHTLPNHIKKPKYAVRITNAGRPAFAIGPTGSEVGEPIPTGGVLFEGMASTVTCATTPYYGYKMKMFPFATGRQGRFQLRVVTMTPLQIAQHIYSAWNGELRHPGLLDYYVDKGHVEFEETIPYQLGGEATGYRKEITFSLAKNPTKMVSFH